MQQAKLFRSSVAIREETNGYYTVYASHRFEHEDMGTSEEYAYLAWHEVSDLVLSLLANWEELRKVHHSEVVGLRDSTQMSIF